MNADYANQSEIIDAYDSEQVKVAGYAGLAWTKERIKMGNSIAAFIVEFPSGLRRLIFAHKIAVVSKGFGEKGVAAPVDCQVIPFQPRRTIPVHVIGDRP